MEAFFGTDKCRVEIKNFPIKKRKKDVSITYESNNDHISREKAEERFT